MSKKKTPGNSKVSAPSRDSQLAVGAALTLITNQGVALPLRGGLILKCAYYLIGSLALLLIFAAADAGASVDARDYPGPAWSPYLVGAAIGVLSWLTFYFSDEPIGASSFYAHLAGFLGKVFMPRHTLSRAYFKDNPPSVGWEFAFVVAIIIGGAIAALTSGVFVVGFALARMANHE